MQPDATTLFIPHRRLLGNERLGFIWLHLNLYNMGFRGGEAVTLATPRLPELCNIPL